MMSKARRRGIVLLIPAAFVEATAATERTQTELRIRGGVWLSRWHRCSDLVGRKGADGLKEEDSAVEVVGRGYNTRSRD